MEKLKDIAEIRLGMAFKSAIKDLGEKGELSLIQTKDILSEGLPSYSSLAKVEPEASPFKHLLNKGDVLIRLRGPVFSSLVFDEDFPSVTTNQVAVISCDLNRLLPHYLNWFLNSKYGRRFFEGKNEGSNINKVSSKVLSELEMVLPSIEDQNKIAAIQKNWLQQKSIHQQLITNGDAITSGICNEIFSGKVK